MTFTGILFAWSGDVLVLEHVQLGPLLAGVEDVEAAVHRHVESVSFADDVDDVDEVHDDSDLALQHHEDESVGVRLGDALAGVGSQSEVVGEMVVGGPESQTPLDGVSSHALTLPAYVSPDVVRVGPEALHPHLLHLLLFS